MTTVSFDIPMKARHLSLIVDLAPLALGLCATDTWIVHQVRPALTWCFTFARALDFVRFTFVDEFLCVRHLAPSNMERFLWQCLPTVKRLLANGMSDLTARAFEFEQRN